MRKSRVCEARVGKKEGVDLRIKVFNDFIQPNQQLAEKHLDANYYQYRPFLDNYNQTRHTNLVPVVGVHIEPFGAYSSKYTSLAAVPDGRRSPFLTIR